jgi:UDP-N-acetylglucosamine 2-epimerase (non-hydrolysing)
MVIHLVCGARPNFMKVAPLYHALNKEPWAVPVIVHTGQHYDVNMSDAIFSDLQLPQPDVYLGVGSGTHGEQTARVLAAYEAVLRERWPDLVVVVGDVNSTLAAALAATKLGIKVAHLEAGLRSFDRRMPEEINRLVTDVLADILWAPSADAVENLLNEGVASHKVHLVGNIMIDSLEALRNKIESQSTYLDFGLESQRYGVVTLHRPANVDDPDILTDICRLLVDVSVTLPLVFPIHPRTRTKIAAAGLLASSEREARLILPEPQSYLRFMNLVFNARLVITDSGGIQEETTHLGIPCLTFRENTERPITLSHGTNQLCGLTDLTRKVDEIICGHVPRRQPIELWDGRTAERIVAILRSEASTRTAPVGALTT